MLKVLLWDIDGTLLDFKAAERAVVPLLFERFGLGECTEEMLRTYSKINEEQWARLERGEDTKRNILVGRFRELFERYGLDVSVAPAFNDAYQPMLGEFVFPIPGAIETVREFKVRGIPQYAVTNGTKKAQSGKLKVSGLDKLFDDIFISEEVGYEKPDQRFFDHVLTAIGPVDRKEVLIIGDSLTSDMAGGCAAGILTCRFDPKGHAGDTALPIDFTVNAIPDVIGLVERLAAE